MGESTTKILITDYAWPDLKIEQDMLSQEGFQIIQPSSTDETALVEAAWDSDAIMTNWAQVTRAVIQASSRCRIVARMGIGLDNIDIEYCTSQRIPVTNVPDYCVEEVAEQALALIMALGRQIHHYHWQTQQGIYDLGSGQKMFRMKNQIVGIVGLGNTGRALAERCLDLGFQVLITSRSGQKMEGAATVPLSKLLSKSDYVSLHLPLDDTTQSFIGAAELQQMKPTAYLINTARGGLIDHQALAQAINSNQLAGAGLDVQVPEPPDLTQPPYDDPRVIVTPHAAFVSQEALTNLRTRACQQVIDQLQGRTPEHVVNGIV